MVREEAPAAVVAVAAEAASRPPAVLSAPSLSLLNDIVPGDAILHCVSADFRMRKGLAREIRARFPLLPDVSHAAVGDAIPQRVPGGAIVIHLVTKTRFFHKPSVDSLMHAVASAAALLAALPDVHRIRLPRLGCGLDRLEWPTVRPLVLAALSAERQLPIVLHECDDTYTPPAADPPGTPPASVWQHVLPSGVPDEWCLDPLAHSPLLAAYGGLRLVSLLQDLGPFRAARLSLDRLREFFAARGFISPDLPPIPLSLSDITAIAFPDMHLPTTGRIPPASAAASAAASEFEKAAACGAVEPLAFGDMPQSWAPLFAIWQSTKYRLIFDLRTLNAHLLDPSFHMETILDIPALTAGCRVGTKLDLRSAYYQYPVSDCLSRALHCRHPISGDFYRWRSLPFGLSHAPRVFSQLTLQFVRHWRAQGIVAFAYLDDVAVFAPDAATLARHLTIVLADLAAAGLRVSAQKAFTAPFAVFELLGLMVDLPARRFFLSRRRCDRLSADAAALLAVADAAPRLQVEQFLGRLAFATMICPLLGFFRAHLSAALSSELSLIRLSAAAREELEWWRVSAVPVLAGRHFRWDKLGATRLFADRGVSSPVPAGAATAGSDASEDGIGLRFQDGSVAFELLPPELRGAPSAAREFYALARLLEAGRFPAGSCVRLVTDAQAVASSWFGGSACASTAQYARRLLLSAWERDVTVAVDWLPRELMTVEDEASRLAALSAANAMPPRDWVSAELQRAFGTGVADAELFADPGARLFPAAPCGSRLFSPAASLGDGITSGAWLTARAGWAFPPFALVRPLLAHLAALPSPPQVLCLLPDNSLTRFCLRAWSVRPPPPNLLAPPDFTVPFRPAVRLALFVPPPPPA